MAPVTNDVMVILTEGSDYFVQHESFNEKLIKKKKTEHQHHDSFLYMPFLQKSR